MKTGPLPLGKRVPFVLDTKITPICHDNLDNLRRFGMFPVGLRFANPTLHLLRCIRTLKCGKLEY